MTRPVVTPFGPVANPRGNVIPLHRGHHLRVVKNEPADICEQPRDPIDLRVNQLKLRVHPTWQRLVRSFCIAVAVFAIVYFGGQELVR